MLLYVQSMVSRLRGSRPFQVSAAEFSAGVVTPVCVARRVAQVLSLCFLLALSGCGEIELLSDISARDAVEISNALFRVGIPVSREHVVRSGKESYTLTISPRDEARALEILSALDVPRDNDQSFSDLLEGKNFVPESDDVSRLKIDRALGLEIERLILALPSVSRVRAQVRSNGSLNGGPKRAGDKTSVTLFVVATSDDDKLIVTDDQLRTAVLGVLPGLDPAAMTFTLVKDAATTAGGIVVSLLTPFSFRVISTDRLLAQQQIAVVIFVTLGCSIIVGFGMGWWVGNQSGFRGTKRKN